MSALRHVEHCMGTVFSFDIREPGVDPAVLDEAIALLHRIDATYSTYRPESVISQLNAGALHVSQVSPEVRQVLDECRRWDRSTRGLFAARINGHLDPSGYVKGWAIRSVSDLLVAAGSTSHCVNGGGDVQCVGTASAGAPWRVGVTDPRDPARLVTVVAGIGLAVATSGSSERGPHILDPRTGFPPPDPLLSLTVIGTDVIECDVWATAGFAAGASARELLGAQDLLSAFAVSADGSTWRTGRVAADTRLH